MNAEGKKSYMQVFPLLFPAQKKVQDIYFSELSRLHILTIDKMGK